MKLRSLSPDILVTDQLLPADFTTLASQGIASVVCNRPDDEQLDQPDHLTMQAACASAGMRFAYLPVVAGAISDRQVQQFCELLGQLPAPVAAYCRTGARSTSLWALCQVRSARLTCDQLLSIASGAGYDLSTLAPRLGCAPPPKPE
ncbi:TIGR01244 family sulfur transferase [Xanthomonas nasturtii]|uniref:TIGR01244 family phosphatase n=1 Tax=Xanthomonas nasturtii TaxID=1843581 RepID=A0A3E1KSC2_9XANT|nr:TIGR01244 family sulfur transferase [Xanthomonas nasturtii]MCL1500486.1 TIGR01244 family sulfur transferase [Xanthomonas nasturtii]MCL1504310.1 TIGR01244 family sulfur transferase [Xanthomonas nasturtii]MCL1523615.1 TIGR01244 family sulfur transferase [Xanthomonas nasturtii]MCL1526939.1 TIGR01244 family sulfur transferase [Xanthomonas nasturtii]MCL1531115.1 TIGR01244 family sulfur transferase [Xanthomonas nasturtii]